VIRPAAYCGVYGFKPSFARVPAGGLLYFSPSVDHVGLLGADLSILVRAARVLLGSMHDERRGTDPITLAVPVGPYLLCVEPAARAVFESTLAQLEAAGVRLRRVPVLNDIDAVAARHQALVAREFALQHADAYRRWGALYRPQSANLVREGLALSDDDVQRGRASIAELRARLDRRLAEYGADAWISPAATGPAPAGQLSTGSPAASLPWTHAGVPAVSLPAGAIEAQGGDLPLGVQLAGRFGEDERLLALALDVDRRVASAAAGS